MSWLDALFAGVTRIRFNGSPLPAEGALNFTGAGVSSVDDNPADGSTDVDIEGGVTPPASAMLPMQYDFWVGVQSTPTDAPTGAQDAPFATPPDAAAVASALPSGSYITLHITQFDNTAATIDLTTHPDAPGPKTWRVVSECGGSAFGDITADTTDGDVVVVLDDVTASGLSFSGESGNASVIARGRGGQLGNIDGDNVASVYIDKVEASRVNTPGGQLTAYSATIVGNVDVSTIGRIDDTAFGASAEDVPHFNVGDIGDPSRQNFTQCQFHSSYGYTCGGTNVFPADDFTLNQFAKSFGDLSGTTVVYLDEQNISQQATFGFGTVGAGASVTATAAVTGTKPSIAVAVSPLSNLPDFIVMQSAFCDTGDSVSIQVFNVGLSPVILGNVDFSCFQGLSPRTGV